MKFILFLQMMYTFFNQHVTLTFDGPLGVGLTQLWRALGDMLFPF